MGNIYIANSDILGYEHLYLVYDPQSDFDENLSSTWTNDLVIRGGPQLIPEVDPILIENGELVLDSRDKLDGDDPIADRNYTLLSSSAASLWASMGAFTDTLGTAVPGNPEVVTDRTYHALGTNSNAVINTILNQAGIDLREYMPQASTNYPGHMSLLDGDGNSNYTAFIHDSLINETTYFYKRGGDDTITLEYDSGSGERGRVETDNDTVSTGMTTIVFTGLDYSDVVFERNTTTAQQPTETDELLVLLGGQRLANVFDFYTARSSSATEGAQVTSFEFDDYYYRHGDAGDNTFDASGQIKKAYLNGFGGTDILTGGTTDDVLMGGAGDDVVDGGGGVDTIEGGADNDVFRAHAGTSTYDGGEGYDILDFDYHNVDLTNTATMTFEYEVEEVQTGVGDDILLMDRDRVAFIYDGGDGVSDHYHNNITSSGYFYNGFGYDYSNYIYVDANGVTIDGRIQVQNVESFEYLRERHAMIETLGHEYTNVIPDYTKFTGTLTYDFVNNTVSDGTSTDTFTSLEQIIGSHNDDTYTISGSDVSLRLGEGDNTINGSLTSSSFLRIHYTSGDQEIDISVQQLQLFYFYLDEGIEQSDVSINYINVTSSPGIGASNDYEYDLEIIIANRGKITIRNLDSPG